MIKSSRYFYFPIFFGFLLFCLINIIFLKIVDYNASQKIWFEEKISKVFYLKSLNKKFDIIFIGSSQTQNHINCNILKKYNISSFNLGLAGQSIYEHLYTFKNAASLSNKFIVVSVSPKFLFKQITFPQRPTFDEILYFTFIQPESLKTFHMECLLNALPITRFIPFIEIHNNSMLASSSRLNMLKQQYSYNDDERDIYYIRGSKNRLVTIFTNGDGQAFSNRVKPGEWLVSDNFINAEFDNSTIKFLTHLSNIALCHGIKMIINISPGSSSHYQIINISRLQSLIPNSIVIDTQLMNSSDYWADEAHLNYEGTSQYTNLLAKILLPYLK